MNKCFDGIRSRSSSGRSCRTLSVWPVPAVDLDEELDHNVVIQKPLAGAPCALAICHVHRGGWTVGENEQRCGGGGGGVTLSQGSRRGKSEQAGIEIELGLSPRLLPL